MKQNVTKDLMDWYEVNKRDLEWRENHDAYRIWVSEIMLQQTRVEAVKEYYHRFIQALPTLETLAKASDEQLHKLWEGLGYYNRVMNMKKCAIQCMEEYGGQLPSTYEALLKLPGIGSYTAGAIASIAYDIPVCAVDGNVMRVFSRLLNDDHDISKPQTKKHFEQIVQEYEPSKGARIFNQAIMELGALICVPNGTPNCEKCPLSSYCEAKQNHLIEKLPVKSSKKKRKIEDKTVVVYLYQNKIHLTKRKEDGLLASLFEFDVLEEKISEKQLEKQLMKQYDVKQIVDLGKTKHIFTHLEWHMQGYLVILNKPFEETSIWVSMDELENQYAIPTAYQKYKEATKMWLKGTVWN